MSYPCDPPPYTDTSLLILPPQPEDYAQLGPSAVEYSQLGVDPGVSRQPVPSAGGCPQPGGYASSGDSPQPKVPVPPMPAVPMNLGDSGLPTGDSSIITCPEEDVIRTGAWDDRSVRHAFIRKVYTIISVQLLVTVGIIAVFTFYSPVRTFVQRNVAVYYASYAVFLVTYLVLACCQGPRRRFPWNIILLSLFTLAMAFMTGTIASMYSTKAVLIAMVITAIVTIIVTVFCFQTKVDFTSCAGLLCVLLVVLFLTSIVTTIVLCYKYVPWLQMVFAALGTVVFTLFLAYDTQLLLGNRQYALSPEDYISGALEIYVDIIYIFWFLLRLVGWR
ncbi:protein lifeguard 3-like [Carettochelys insculpta]|uniref:protein lifeguard 3-like n=1 Tax=Carettochelys insculpta TaxID=44489 RepID=UPI003EBA347C